MVLLSVENLQKAFGPRTILDKVTFGIEEGEKVGIIGRNGAGKTTLLRMLMGLETPDDGRIIRNNEANIVYLGQQVELDPTLTALEAVLDDPSELFRVVKQYEHILVELTERPEDTKVQNRLMDLSSRMDALGGWSLESDAKSVLGKLGIQDLTQTVATMSGGQQKRVALAQALIRPCDLLILDEPTNHLDVDTVQWLEGYLASRTHAVMLITHDRYFLDRVANVILEIHDGTIDRHPGNYSTFLERRAHREELDAIAEQKRKQMAKKELEWLRRGPKARTTKSKSRIERAVALQTGKQVQEEELEFDFVGSRLGRKIVEIEHASKSYGDKTVIRDFTYFFPKGDRVGVVGPNGAGKTTLLNLICGRQLPDTGSVEIGQTVNFAYYDQQSVELDESMRVHKYISEISNRIETSQGSLSASQMLERFGFTRDRQQAIIKTLSGGERRRLYLLRTLISKPNVIILDEPTNDLDVDTLAELEDYLDDFPGVLIVVSHDRYFIDRTVDHLLVIEEGGEVREFPGNYSAYAETRTAPAAAKKTVAPPMAEAKPVDKDKKKLTFKEKLEHDTLEKRIAEIEELLPKLDKKMAANASDFDALQRLTDERTSLQNELEASLERWMELAEFI
ncbi:MAG: ABC-F family ATP-binding cassette domain-containing protein [bacterium]